MFSSQTRSMLAGLLLPLAGAGCSTTSQHERAERPAQDSAIVDRTRITSLKTEHSELLTPADASLSEQALPARRYTPLVEQAPLDYRWGPISREVGTISLYAHKVHEHDFLIAHIRSAESPPQELSVFFPIERAGSAEAEQVVFRDAEHSVALQLGPAAKVSFQLSSAENNVLDTIRITIREAHQRQRRIDVEFPTKHEAIISESGSPPVRVRWNASFGAFSEAGTK